LNLELSEEKRRIKDTSLARLQDEVSSTNRKYEALQEEMTKLKNKCSRDVTRAKHEVDNIKADLETATREKSDVEQKLNSQIRKLQATTTTDRSRILELEKVDFLTTTRMTQSLNDSCACPAPRLTILPCL
jgi:hypothetical protein